MEIIWLISIYHYVASDRLTFSWCSNWWEVMMTSLSLCHVMVYNKNPINSCQLTRLWQFYQLALNFLLKINKVKLCFCKTNLKTWMNVFKIWYHFLSPERKVLRDFKNMFFLLYCDTLSLSLSLSLSLVFCKKIIKVKRVDRLLILLALNGIFSVIFYKCRCNYCVKLPIYILEGNQIIASPKQ